MKAAVLASRFSAVMLNSTKLIECEEPPLRSGTLVHRALGKTCEGLPLKGHINALLTILGVNNAIY